MHKKSCRQSEWVIIFCNNKDLTLLLIFYEVVVKEVENIANEPTLPWQRQIPCRIDDGFPNYQFICPKDYFRLHYVEIMAHWDYTKI